MLPIGSVVFRFSGKPRSDGPASTSATRQPGSADSRLASTQPAAPAPITMKSKPVAEALKGARVQAREALKHRRPPGVRASLRVAHQL
jgi:hypothetical protein